MCYRKQHGAYGDGGCNAGAIPASLSNAIYLTTFAAQDNGLSGMIPDSLGSLPLLASLRLSNNTLTGCCSAPDASSSHGILTQHYRVQFELFINEVLRLLKSSLQTIA